MIFWFVIAAICFAFTIFMNKISVGILSFGIICFIMGVVEVVKRRNAKREADSHLTQMCSFYDRAGETVGAAGLDITNYGLPQKGIRFVVKPKEGTVYLATARDWKIWRIPMNLIIGCSINKDGASGKSSSHTRTMHWGSGFSTSETSSAYTQYVSRLSVTINLSSTDHTQLTCVLIDERISTQSVEYDEAMQFARKVQSAIQTIKANRNRWPAPPQGAPVSWIPV